MIFTFLICVVCVPPLFYCVLVILITFSNCKNYYIFCNIEMAWCFSHHQIWMGVIRRFVASIYKYQNSRYNCPNTKEQLLAELNIIPLITHVINREKSNDWVLLLWLKALCCDERIKCAKIRSDPCVLVPRSLFRFTKCNWHLSESKSILSTPKTTTKRKLSSWPVSHDRILLWYKPKFIIFIFINEYLFNKFILKIYTIHKVGVVKRKNEPILYLKSICNNAFKIKKLRIYGHERNLESTKDFGSQKIVNSFLCLTIYVCSKKFFSIIKNKN